MRRNSYFASILLAASAPVLCQSELQTSQITAPSAIVVNGDTGDILWSKSAFTRRPMASTTKMMTAIVARDFTRMNVNNPLRKRLTDEVTVGLAPTLVGGSVAGLEFGEKLTLHDLLRCLMLPSGNDAAVAIAEFCAVTEPLFVVLMNQKAAQLGLSDTQYFNAHGKDPIIDGLHFSTVADLARIGRELLTDSVLAEIVSTSRVSVVTDKKTIDLKNSNDFLNDDRYPGTIGIKTGTTQRAGHCLVAAARRANRTIITVVLGSDDGKRYVDSRKLMDFGFDVRTKPPKQPMAVGDFNRDYAMDIAIGIPDAEINGQSNAGKVLILMGRPTGRWRWATSTGTASTTSRSACRARTSAASPAPAPCT
jgi:D-alanyl-D-alanine carboxypeptidase (penicillin-binding protein 5/6)